MDLSVIIGIVIILIIIKIFVKSLSFFFGVAAFLILLTIGISLLNDGLGTDITIMGSIEAAFESIKEVLSKIGTFLEGIF